MSTYIKSFSSNTCKRMISSALFTESLVISCLWNSNIPPSRTGLPYIMKRMNAQPNQELTGRFVQTTKKEVILPTQSQQPMKSNTTTVKRKCDMSGRVSYSISSQGRVKNKDTLGAVEKLSVAGLVGGGKWGIEWCRLIEIVAQSYYDHGPNNSEKSYVDKVFYSLYAEGIASIRERTIYSTIGGVSICRGRVDLEIDNRFLLEFKVVEPSANQISKDRKQLIRYLVTYFEYHTAPMEKAALVYLFGGEVRVIEVSLETDKNVRYSPY